MGCLTVCIMLLILTDQYNEHCLFSKPAASQGQALMGKEVGSLTNVVGLIDKIS